MSSPVLTLIANTDALYGLDSLLFLLADTAGAPGSLPLDSTWGPPPSQVGHYLFTAGAIPSPASAFETALRSLLPPPAASGTAWVSVAADGTPALACRIEAAADGTVAADAAVTVGATRFVLPAGTPLAASYDTAGDLAGFTTSAPPVPGGRPRRPATSVAFLGKSGGCFTFTGLLNLFASPVSATLQVVNAVLDPLQPTVPERTRITFTGTTLSLVPAGSGYRLKRPGA